MATEANTFRQIARRWVGNDDNAYRLFDALIDSGPSVYIWEEKAALLTSTSGGRQWALGNGVAGGTAYVSERAEVVSFALSIELEDATSTDDIIHPESTVVMETTGDGDTDTERVTISGLTVTASATADGTGNRAKRAVLRPTTPIIIPAGSWIRPVTTAPASAGASDTTNASTVTLTLRGAG